METTTRLAEASLSGYNPGREKSIVLDVNALKHRTNIDRRQCSRTVPMQVLCLGMPRTASSSIRAALIQLGYYDVYHYASIHNENPRDAEMWDEAFRGKFEGGQPFTKADWDQLLGHCMAVSDTPCIAFAEELIETYPDAKVILTVRDSAEQWRQSMIETVIPGFGLAAPDAPLLGRILYLLKSRQPFWSVMRKIYQYERLGAIAAPGGEQVYHDHNEKIKQLVPPERLLIYNAKDGWAPLCTFLNKDVPDTPFPRVNDRAEFVRNLIATKKVAGKETLRLLVTIVAVGWVLSKLLGKLFG